VAERQCRDAPALLPCLTPRTTVSTFHLSDRAQLPFILHWISLAACFSSPHTRARQTTENSVATLAVWRHTVLEPQHLPCLAEVDLGLVPGPQERCARPPPPPAHSPAQCTTHQGRCRLVLLVCSCHAMSRCATWVPGRVGHQLRQWAGAAPGMMQQFAPPHLCQWLCGAESRPCSASVAAGNGFLLLLLCLCCRGHRPGHTQSCTGEYQPSSNAADVCHGAEH